MRIMVFAAIIALTIADSAGHLFSAGAPGAEPSKTLQAILDAAPPDPNTTPKAELLKIYLERARIAGALGDVDRQLRELNEGIRVIGPKDALSYELYNLAGRILTETGDWQAARSMRDNAQNALATEVSPDGCG